LCPFDILSRDDINLVIAGQDNVSLTHARAFQVQTNVRFVDMIFGTYDCVIFPGGLVATVYAAIKYWKTFAYTPSNLEN
jgi:hypothetical protein